MTINEFFNSAGWQIFLQLMSIIGFIGTIIGFKTAFTAKKENKRLSFILKNLDQSITLEDKTTILQEKTNEITEKDAGNNRKKEELQEIPLLAQKMALKGIIDYEVELLSKGYTRIKVLRVQLGELKEGEQSENSLLDEISKEIEPTYSSNRSQNILTVIYLFISVIATALAAFIPSSVYSFLSPIVLIAQIAIVGRIVMYSLKSNYTNTEISVIYKKMSLFSSAFFLFITIILGTLIILSEGINLEFNGNLADIAKT